MFLINAIRLIVEPYNAVTAIILPHFGFKQNSPDFLPPEQHI